MLANPSYDDDHVKKRKKILLLPVLFGSLDLTYLAVLQLTLDDIDA